MKDGRIRNDQQLIVVQIKKQKSDNAIGFKKNHKKNLPGEVFTNIY